MKTQHRQVILVVELEGENWPLVEASLDEVALWAEANLTDVGRVVDVTAYGTLTHALIGEQFNSESKAPQLEGHLTFPDWRIIDGAQDPVPEALSQPGTVELSLCGYGAVMEVATPTGDCATVGMEFDAGAFKAYFYGPVGPGDGAASDGAWVETSDEPLCSVVVTREGLIVSSGYGATGTLFGPEGTEAQCLLYDGEAVIKAHQDSDEAQRETEATSGGDLLDVNFYLGAAEQHGEDSDPDHEVGDLQDWLRVAFTIMTPEQRRAFAVRDEVRATLDAALGDDDLLKKVYADLGAT